MKKFFKLGASAKLINGRSLKIWAFMIFAGNEKRF
jgi:hypothetical protein